MPQEKAKAVGVEIPCVALGEDNGVETAEVIRPNPKSVEEAIEMLREQQLHMTTMLDNVFIMVKELREKVDHEKEIAIKEILKIKKSDSVIPEGTVLHGTSQGLSFFLQVRDGGFWVNNTKYESLSAAAQAVSGLGTRRSGWVFWRFPDGKTVKETLRS